MSEHASGLAAQGRAPRQSRDLSPAGPRLTRSEFAYLRAISQGVAPLDAARHYLAVAHAHQAPAAGRRVVERARAFVRQRGDSRWRLIGLSIPEAPPAEASAVPSVEAWAQGEGLEDWSWAELVDLHAERFGAGGSQVQAARLKRNERLIARRLALLRELEDSPQLWPRATDALDGWLVPELVESLKAHGIVMLGELQALIARGGRWWTMLPAYGPVKAARLAAHVADLTGHLPALAAEAAWDRAAAHAALARLEGGRVPAAGEAAQVLLEAGEGSEDVAGGEVIEAIERLEPRDRAPSAPMLAAHTDRQAMAAWISARAGSAATAASYQREAERFVLWAALVPKVGLAGVTVEHCRAYADFISDVPLSWQSRRCVARHAPGWAPFRGPLSIASQRLALTIVHAWFRWLVESGYLERNPWTLLNRRLGDDPTANDDPTSRAFTPQAWGALFAELDDYCVRAPESGARLRWLLTFAEATGLRASELLRARREDLVQRGNVWVLKVFGKGRKRRLVVVPEVAVDATREYLAFRGLAFERCAPHTPLVGSLEAPGRGNENGAGQGAATEDEGQQKAAPRPGAVSYTALYMTLKRLVVRAAGRLSPGEARTMRRASLHWLRHTFATRAAEAGIAINDIQEQLGQADPRTAARYSRAQIEHRAKAFGKVWGKRRQAGGTGAPPEAAAVGEAAQP